MELAIPWYLDTPLGTITFVRAGDGYRVQQVQNMDGAQIRAASEQLPAWDGAIVYDSYRGGRFPVLSGIIKSTDAPWAMTLNGTTQYATVADSVYVQPESTGKFSFATWIKFRSLSTVTLPRIWDKTNHGLLIADQFSTNPYRLRLEVTALAVNHQWTGSTVFVTDRWYHVANTFDNATGTAVIYVNGVPETLTKTAGGAWTNGAALQSTSGFFFVLGRDSSAATGFLDGSLRGPIGFWREVLTPGEIRTLYEQFDLAVYPAQADTVPGFFFYASAGTGTTLGTGYSGASAGATFPAGVSWEPSGTDVMLMRRRLLEDKLRAYTDSLTRADGTLRFVPSGATERQLTVRLLDAIQIQGIGVMKEWQIALQAGDPLIYSTTLNQVDTGTVGAASGSETFPFGYPAGFGVTSSAAPGVAVNAGTAPTWPVFQIYGPANSPAVQLAETGESFVLMGLSIAAGHYVEVDVRNNAVTLDGESDQSLVSYLDPATARLPKLGVGTNTINFYGGTIASAAKVRTIWRDGFV
jgi:hypothetical protein